MTITIRTHPLEGETWRQATTKDSASALRGAASTESDKVERLMQSSLDAEVTPSDNGLVDAAIEAWNNHHHLALRPDDVWLAIISQLGFFINLHAEELRAFFVAHEGQKQLEVSQYGDPDTVDYASFASQMAGQIAKNVNDPELVPWIMPDFTTTTDTDRVAASVLLMGAMQKYFLYSFSCSTCGIPSVTLLGDRDDWAKLQARIERIPNLGGEAIEFYSLLRPIARHMLLSFDEPTSDAVLKFWRAIASWERPRYQMSGGPSRHLSGWITAFCFWTAKGHRNYGLRDEDTVRSLDDVRYLPLAPDAKVAGWASVPVTVKSVTTGEQRKCRMVAGSVGMKPGKHTDLSVSLGGLAPPPAEHDQDGEGDAATGKVRGRRGVRLPPRLPPPFSPTALQPNAPPAGAGLDAVQPYIGWWIFQEKDETRESGNFTEGLEELCNHEAMNERLLASILKADQALG
ncbi:hypothetical protein B0T25DRAFT_578652 [Lasiosphaeria hispida]|uniref:DUF4419 domain-containing protein n=1 Tax=Lasiosphaeria hispida TaxID=260671 RepID=A0AAJ0HK98_9PEZI|nr:hypothetical protein B0T25DRAFT_578652 [Lasiosphaeria hispida]